MDTQIQLTTHAYTLTFSDGKHCTVIDPEREPMDRLFSALKKIFKPGYLISIKPLDVSVESVK
jgi:hypothetical protein